MEEDVQTSCAVPEEEGLLVLGLAIDEVERLGHDLIVKCLHPLGRQWPFVFGRTIGGPGDHSARIKLLAELGISRTVWIFEVFVTVQVIEIAEILVETMTMWQMIFEVAQVILTKLSCGVTLRL